MYRMQPKGMHQLCCRLVTPLRDGDHSNIYSIIIYETAIKLQMFFIGRFKYQAFKK